MGMKEKERNYGLDVLRIVAAVGIVLLHYQQYILDGGMYFGSVWLDTYNGSFKFRFLVEIFFVLSGYLHYRQAKRIRGGLRFPEYIKEKLIRILPMLGITVIVYEIFLCFLFQNGMRFWSNPYYPNLWGIVTAALGIADCWCFESGGVLMISWYLGGLLLCYTIYYFIIFISDRKKIHENHFFVGMVILGCALKVWANDIPFLNTANGRAYAAFFSGVLLAAILEKICLRTIHYIISAVAFFLTVACFIFFPGFTAMGQTCILHFIVAPAWIILSESPFMRKMLRWRGLGELGKWTYSLYLWHVPLILIVLDVLDWNGLNLQFQQPVVFAAFLLLAFVWSALSYYLIERPITARLKKHIAKAI